MTTRSLEHLSNLTPEQRTQVEQCIDAFEQAWERGERPALDDHLPADPVLRKAVIVELVHIDLELRIKAGESARCEVYFQHFPELFRGQDQMIDLIQWEFGCRNHREAVTFEEYLERFPWIGSKVPLLMDPLVSGGLTLPPRDQNSHRSIADSTFSDEVEAGTNVGSSTHCRGHFRGNDRFALGPLLGAGAMGEVYEAYDRQRRQRIALKVLPRIDSTTLSQFKHEFRSLVGLTHPNLVTFYELFSDESTWFYTMERVEGVDFIHFVRPVKERPLNGSDWQRLRSCLVQVVHGLVALHRAGKVHRDIKPSNILVTAAGRVVILDPGLVHEIDQRTLHPTEESLAGTVAYMAPEQADQKSTFASDWYSVGAMLYETLTGKLPFRGSLAQILGAKLQFDPHPPCELEPSVPKELDGLCRALLSRRPEERPTADEILARIESAHPVVVQTSMQPVATLGPASSVFVGRAYQLGTLWQAFEATTTDHPVSVFVHGESGVGKSALVERFLTELKESPVETVVLQGRCYERESVPYKALDSVVDALSRYLRRLSETELSPILPRNPVAVCQLFPILGRVDLIGRELERAPRNADQQELRRRGIEGLREMLGRLSDRRRIVIFIDDLQWGDRDSGLLIRRLLGPPDPPALLLIGCYRTADRSRSDCLESLLSPVESDFALGTYHELMLERMTEEEIRSLVSAIHQGDQRADDQSAEIVLRDSQGSPYFAAELTRFAREQTATFYSSANTLDNLLWQRVEGLPIEARQLMETIAVAGHPLFIADAWAAAGLSPEHQPALDLLAHQRLVRTSGTSKTPAVEPYHDRVRETVVLHLGIDRRRELHAALALTLEASASTDPEVIANHFRESGNPSAAARHYAISATNARAALAFERSAALYRQCLECLPPGDRARQTLRIELADALADAGRGREAADQYLAAARDVSSTAQLDLNRRAAEQLLASGHIAYGLAVFRQVLKSVGIVTPATTARVLFALSVERIRNRAPNLRSHKRQSAEQNHRTILQADACWAAAVGLALVDTIRAALFQEKGLRLALKSGDRLRIGRASSFQAAFLYAVGASNAKMAERHLACADAVANETQNAYLRTWNLFVRGVSRALQGFWRDALTYLSKAEAMRCEHGIRDLWLTASIRRFSLYANVHLGNFNEVAEVLPRLLDDATSRADVYSQVSVGTFIEPYVNLACDQPQRARQRLSRILQICPEGVDRFVGVMHEVEIDMYLERPSVGWQRLEDSRLPLARTGFLRLQQMRIFWSDIRGRCAVAAADQDSSGYWQRRASRAAKSLSREGLPWPAACAEVILAGISNLGGDVDAAFRHLHAAHTLFGRTEMRVHQACIERILCRESAEPGQLQADIDSRLSNQGIASPEAFSQLLVPGFSGMTRERNAF